MADETGTGTPTKPLNMVVGLMEEARAEMLKANRKKWVVEIKEKMSMVDRARKVLRNCERELEDLEMRIAQDVE